MELTVLEFVSQRFLTSTSLKLVVKLVITYWGKDADSSPVEVIFWDITWYHILWYCKNFIAVLLCSVKFLEDLMSHLFIVFKYYLNKPIFYAYMHAYEHLPEIELACGQSSSPTSLSRSSSQMSSKIKKVY